MRFLCILFCLAGIAGGESVAGMRWTAPPGWKAEAPRPMRAATYRIAPAAGDKADAECAIYFFGPGQGGSAEANIERWKNQVLGADGKPARAKIGRRTIHGLPVTTINSSGTYTGMGGPMAATQTLSRNYRLIGAIVEGPEGNVFLKFAGPARTVEQNEPKFERLLNSFAKLK